MSTLAEGDKAPAFDLPATGDRQVSLAGLRGKPVLLYFYPKADTPGCTRQACGLQEALPQLQKVGAEVIGVSRDKMPALEKFAGKYALTFTLASDAEGKASEAYGTWVEKTLYGRKYMGMERSSFLIGADGKLKKIWRNVKVPGHAQAVMDAVAAL